MADMTVPKSQNTDQLIAQRVLVKKRKGISRRRKIEKACPIEAILTFYMLNPCGKRFPKAVFLKRVPVQTRTICCSIKRLPKKCQKIREDRPCNKSSLNS